MDDGAMTSAAVGPPGALARVLPRIGGAEVVERLSALSGSEFTTVMLEVARRRAARQTPASVLRRYGSDRFVRPGTLSCRSLRRAEDALLRCLPPDVEVVTLAPLVPLATHSALGTVSQHKVVTAMRACEVAADPTNALALEAAARRLQDRDAMVRLAATQRVVRAQQFSGPGSFAHFSLFGLVTAGRDRGSQTFERQALAEQVTAAAHGLAAAGLAGIQLALTPLSAAGERLAAAVTQDLSAVPIEIAEDHGRQAGRGYYRDLCFKLNARTGGGMDEVGDGGFTDWTMRLTASGKERLLISGVGIDRVAILAGPP